MVGLYSQAINLGLNPPRRDSGKLYGTPDILIRGPKGEVKVRNCVIIAKRHIHLAPDDAKKLKINDQEEVRVRAGIGKDREMVFERVLCRVSDKYILEFHVDIEEANSALLKTGESAFLV